MAKAPAKKKVNVALQGGGAHGALAWGILDAILEDGRLEVEGFSATSAGTMNALAFVQGMQEGGPDGARAKMEHFWWEISKAGIFFSPVHGNPIERFLGLGSGENPFSYFMFDSMTRLFSPYQFNPLDINPLRSVLDDTIDFDKIRECSRVKLFISATNVRTGKVKIFRNEDVDIEVAMASSCLPFLFKSVEIDGEYYWDGGYSGNPALYPLFYQTESDDIVLIHLNPMFREEVPVTAPAIMNRLNEVSFNASLLKEFRAIAFVKKLIEHDMIKDEYKHMYKDIKLHSIRADDMMRELSIASKFETDWDFLVSLRDLGREGMKVWLGEHFDNIGSRSSVDLNEEFLTEKGAHNQFFSKSRLNGKKKKKA
ncbi:MAG: alpha/beta hydrolase [Micavibrio aeruginosavorus]|uniref:Alpha/beta hydrolase n=1 Tax=Micavibrio aeruginosavorus TaxID=349221 RepID=A0A2W5MTY8_9BACT|nr:MAG: alpha/beta hydrolase [Micavibrio aeruginosavorus]